MAMLLVLMGLNAFAAAATLTLGVALLRASASFPPLAYLAIFLVVFGVIAAAVLCYNFSRGFVPLRRGDYLGASVVLGGVISSTINRKLVQAETEAATLRTAPFPGSASR
jgi:hypothetical protein